MHFHGHPSIHRRATHCFSSVFDRYSMPPSGPNSAPGSYCKPMRPPHIKMYTLRCTFRWSHVFTLLTAPEYIKTRRRSLRERGGYCYGLVRAMVGGVCSL